MFNSFLHIFFHLWGYIMLESKIESRWRAPLSHLGGVCCARFATIPRFLSKFPFRSATPGEASAGRSLFAIINGTFMIWNSFCQHACKMFIMHVNMFASTCKSTCSQLQMLASLQHWKVGDCQHARKVISLASLQEQLGHSAACLLTHLPASLQYDLVCLLVTFFLGNPPLYMSFLKSVRVAIELRLWILWNFLIN